MLPDSHWLFITAVQQLETTNELIIRLFVRKSNCKSTHWFCFFSICIPFFFKYDTIDKWLLHYFLRKVWIGNLYTRCKSNKTCCFSDGWDCPNNSQQLEMCCWTGRSESQQDYSVQNSILMTGLKIQIKMAASCTAWLHGAASVYTTSAKNTIMWSFQMSVVKAKINWFYELLEMFCPALRWWRCMMWSELMASWDRIQKNWRGTWNPFFFPSQQLDERLCRIDQPGRSRLKSNHESLRGKSQEIWCTKHRAAIDSVS